MVAQVFGQFNWGQPYWGVCCCQSYCDSSQIYSFIGQQLAYNYGAMRGMIARQQYMQQMMYQAAMMQQQQAQMAAYTQQMQATQQQQNDNTQVTDGSGAQVSDNKNKDNNQKTEEKTNNDKSSKVTPKEQTLTPEMVKQLINGTYSAPYVKINGVTHYKYSDCKSSDLVSVSSAANGKMHKDAAAAFKKMQAAAQKDGINLNVVSGFRSTAYQKTPFTKKGTSVDAIKNRVKLSAPPGFSEHHTGYACDINSTSESFENTAAYKWLVKHAKEYGFELSFTKGNSQGVAYEPWHWRYVGTEEAKKTFEAARANA